jgi:hypothetical protein
MVITIVQTPHERLSMPCGTFQPARVCAHGTATAGAGRDVAGGDVLLLNEGDRVAADAILRRCGNQVLMNHF